MAYFKLVCLRVACLAVNIWLYIIQFITSCLSFAYLTVYGWNQPGREKAKKWGIIPFMYWVLLTTYIFFDLLEIVMSLKHIEASHIMAFNS